MAARRLGGPAQVASACALQPSPSQPISHMSCLTLSTCPALAWPQQNVPTTAAYPHGGYPPPFLAAATTRPTQPHLPAPSRERLRRRASLRIGNWVVHTPCQRQAVAHCHAAHGARAEGGRAGLGSEHTIHTHTHTPVVPLVAVPAAAPAAVPVAVVITATTVGVAAPPSPSQPVEHTAAGGSAFAVSGCRLGVASAPGLWDLLSGVTIAVAALARR